MQKVSLTESGGGTASGYDRLASVYRVLEYCVFADRLQQARIALLSQLADRSNILVFGDGNGRLLEQLCFMNPTTSIVSVDISKRMIELQQTRVKRAGAGRRVEFIHCDAQKYRPAQGEFDAIICAFFLDCFSQDTLQQQLPVWLLGLPACGLLYFVDFVHPSREQKLRRIQSHVYQAALHCFFRLQTGLPNKRLVDLPQLLQRHNLVLEQSALGLHPMLACQIYRVADRGDD